MRIDIHTHTFHPKIAHKVVNQLESHYGIHPVGTGTAEDLLKRLDTASIDRAVILTAATSPAQVIPANNWAIQMGKDHQEFIPFGTVHPEYSDMESELNRLEKAGIIGLKLHPDFQGFRMDDKSLFDVLEMARNRFICLFHVGDTLPPKLNPSCPKKLADLQRAFPETRMIAAHMGGYKHWEYVKEHLAHTDVFVDSSSVLDFLDPTLLKAIINSFGINRVLFGSDYPLYDPADELKRFPVIADLSDKQLTTIFNNAETLLDV